MQSFSLLILAIFFDSFEIFFGLGWQNGQKANGKHENT